MAKAKKIQISIEDILKKNEERRTLNHIPFEEIEWMHKGKHLEIDKKTLEDWRFIGLSNSDFAEFIDTDISPSKLRSSDWEEK